MASRDFDCFGISSRDGDPPDDFLIGGTIWSIESRIAIEIKVSVDEGVPTFDPNSLSERDLYDSNVTERSFYAEPLAAETNGDPSV